jgi:hypothetical protein
MTAEMKKGKYVYYRCTGFKGPQVLLVAAVELGLHRPLAVREF